MAHESAHLDRVCRGHRHRHASAGSPAHPPAHPRPAWARHHCVGPVCRAGAGGRFREGTFFGELAFDDGTTVSARPSDAIALAVRVEIPVFVEEAVLAEAGIIVPEEPDDTADDSDDEDSTGDAEDEVERFREFLDSVSPDDFGGEQKP